ncbi:hypothetical protein GQ44DRAFT_254171 [Phaeosphaeriaceae sp. PMI808]|nr:hypothetical protein GQ44DRAFT_254171 [Phaeosphaeriaceae sp. PMI808]
MKSEQTRISAPRLRPLLAIGLHHHTSEAAVNTEQDVENVIRERFCDEGWRQHHQGTEWWRNGCGCTAGRYLSLGHHHQQGKARLIVYNKRSRTCTSHEIQQVYSVPRGSPSSLKLQAMLTCSLEVSTHADGLGCDNQHGDCATRDRYLCSD